jgi:hypothetical protein
MSAKEETYKHILTVQKFINKLANELYERGRTHDAPKLESPEVEVFEECTVKLAGLTYGSAEYKEQLKSMEPTLIHHYANTRHHPEGFLHGIHDMNLVDILEMICDWVAATKRHNDGNIRKSIEINQQRFGYSDELKQILYNTLELLES